MLRQTSRLCLVATTAAVTALAVAAAPANATGDHTWPSDGCTAVSDQPGGYDFTDPCVHHDGCYAFRWASRLGCDRQFRRDMLAVCADQLLRADQRACRRWATTYYLGVRAFGAVAYYCDAAAVGLECRIGTPMAV